MNSNREWDLISRLRVHGTTYSSSQGGIIAGKDGKKQTGRGMEEALLDLRK